MGELIFYSGIAVYQEFFTKDIQNAKTVIAQEG